MPNIEIARQHDRPLAEAKQAVERLAKSIAKKFDVEYGWKGNTLHFERPGVHGDIALTRGAIRISAHLSFLLIAIKGAIEQEIERQLDREFG